MQHRAHTIRYAPACSHLCLQQPQVQHH
jgi:hypothetical protein